MLHASLLSTHETTQSSKLLKSRKLTTWLQPSGRSISLPYYIPNPLESESPGLQESRSLHQPRWLGKHVPGTNT
jgi:hypothetical protein